MNHSGFQDEAIQTVLGSRQWQTHALDLPTNFAGLASMFLGLRLRGTLSDFEQEFLDCLAPQGWIAFLADSGGYLHPRGLELFPLESIMGALKLGNGAVFSHRFCPNGADLERAYRIHTVLVNPDDSEPLVIGFAGPEDFADQGRLENRFFELADGARQAYSDAEAMHARLTDSYCSTDPCLVINRGSGRIVALNDAALRSLGANAGDMVDCEVSAVRESLDQAISTQKTKLQTSNRGLLHVGTWTWSASSVKTTLRDTASSLGGVLVEEITALRARFISIEDRAAASNVDMQMDRLERLVHVMGTLVEYSDLPSVSTMLTDGISEAADLVRGHHDASDRIKITGVAGDVNLTCAQGALGSIFESVLRSHRCDTDNMLSCEIEVNALPEIGGCCVSVRSQLDRSASDGFDHVWQNLAERLALRMSMRLRWTQCCESNQLITNVTFTL